MQFGNVAVNAIDIQYTAAVLVASVAMMENMQEQLIFVLG
jgi:hypothetical protein